MQLQGMRAPRRVAPASSARPALRSVVRSAQVATPPSAPAQASGEGRSHDTDVVVIGSGIGGLCCAALLAKYGYKVRILKCMHGTTHCCAGQGSELLMCDECHSLSGPQTSHVHRCQWLMPHDGTTASEPGCSGWATRG